MAENRERDDSQQEAQKNTAPQSDLGRYVFDWRNPNMAAGTAKKQSEETHQDEEGLLGLADGT